MNPTEMGIWMDQKEIDMVIKYLDKNSESIMLEYGCGGSTLLFSKYVKKYISIEHNLDWYIEVRNSIKSNNLNHIDFYLIDVPKEVPTSKKSFYDKWSTEIHKLSKEGLNTIPDLEYCIDPKNRYVWTDYIDAVDEIGIEKYDFVFIDGRARADCAFKVLDYIVPFMPKNKPRYLMGVGTPADILGAVKRGIDMFDCVIPTRSGRTGLAFTWDGRLNLRNSKYKKDNTPISKSMKIRNLNAYSKSYINHLISSNEILASMILTLNNIVFYQQLMLKIREAIKNNTFDVFYKKYINVI